MQAQICSWGNGNAIRLNKMMMEALDLKTHDYLDVKIEDNMIIFRKPFTHKTLEQRVAESGKPLSTYGEYDYGESMGREIW